MTHNPLESAIHTDTRVISYVDKHDTIHNIVEGIDIITATGDNLLHSLGS